MYPHKGWPHFDLLSAGSLYLYDGSPYCNSGPSSLREILNLTSCIPFQADPNSFLSGVFSLEYPRRSFRYKLVGTGIECCPATGLAVSVRSTSESIHACTALIGIEKNNKTMCRYRCKCPDRCLLVIVRSFNTATQSLCEALIYWQTARTHQ